MKSVTNIENILNLNKEINTNIFKGISFEDKNLEENYTENVENGSNFCVSSLVILLGHISTVPYLFFAFYKLIYLIIFLAGFIISLISIIYTYNKNNRTTYNFNRNLQIFLVSNFFLVKGFILLGNYHDPKDDNIEEMLRIIIYHFVSTGIFLITNIESNFFIYLFYFLLNISLVISCQIIFATNRFLHLEGLTSFCLFIIFFLIRREWDHKMRIIFGEKRNFETLYFFVYEYLNGLNGFNINFQNKKLAFYGNKTFNYLDLLAKENYLKEEKKENEYIPIKEDGLDSIKYFIKTENMENSLCSNFLKELNFFEFEKINENPYDFNNENSIRRGK